MLVMVGIVHYRCSTCGKCHVTRSHPTQCLVCANLICDDCISSGLCPVHFKLLSPPDQESLRKAITLKSSAEAKEDIFSVLSAVSMAFFFLALLQWMMTCDLSVGARVIIIGLPVLVFVWSVASLTLARSRLRSANEVIAGLLQKKWDWKDEATWRVPKNAAPPSAYKNNAPLGDEIRLESERNSEIIQGSPPEFREAIAAWKSGRFPLDPEKNDTVIVPRNETEYAFNTFFIGVSAFFGGVFILLGILTITSLTCIFGFVAGFSFIAFFRYSWCYLGIKEGVLLINSKGLMLYSESTPFYVPWSNTLKIADFYSRNWKDTFVEIEVSPTFKARFSSKMWGRPELAWAPPFLEERIKARQSQSFIARLQRQRVPPPHPSLMQVIKECRD